MIRSMTGYGKATCDYSDKKITVEVRSLNSKQMDLNLKMPGIYRDKELELRTSISRRLERGKCELTINIEQESGQGNFSLNKELATKYYQQLKDFQQGLDITSSNFLEIIVKMPEVMKSERPEADDKEWETIQATVTDALNAFESFRKQEGEKLASDFRDRINKILELKKEVEALEPERMETVRTRIEKNLEEMVGKERVDQNRLEQEIIYYLEKMDVTEEKVRLQSHCDYFLETLAEESNTGKKLGFIGQEIGREINTMGSKANHAGIQRQVVMMKDELEKIKEQVLNVL